MKVKLDENLGTRTAGLFRRHGHDVETVHEQGMDGATDDALFRVCVEEDRVLVTLDRDFANPFRFDPTRAPGLAVLRVSDMPGIKELEIVASRLLSTVGDRPIRGRLWVIDALRVREYRPDPTTDE